MILQANREVISLAYAASHLRDVARGVWRPPRSLTTGRDSADRAPMRDHRVGPVWLPRARRSAAEKPRVLLVDDHLGVLERVSAILADTFEVVALARDGRAALGIASRLEVT